MDEVGMPRGCAVSAGGLRGVPPADGAGDAGDAHQARDLVPAHVDACAAGRVPEFADPVDAPVFLVQRHECVHQVRLV